MRRFLVLLFVLLPSPAFGQYVQPYNPYVPVYFGLSQDRKEAMRKEAIAYIHDDAAKAFIDEFQEDGCAAAKNLSQPAAKELARFHADGRLQRFQFPRQFLRAVAHPYGGKDLLRYGLAHADELMDADAFDAFIACPWDYSMNGRSLQDGAAQVRAYRANQSSHQSLLGYSPRTVGLAVGAAVLIALFIYWRKRRMAAL